jgi:hypothetical protein
MLGKTHKSSARSARVACLRALSLSSLLAALAFSGNAHASGLITVAAPGASTAAAQSQVNGLHLGGGNAPLTPSPTADAVAAGPVRAVAAVAPPPAAPVSHSARPAPETARDGAAHTIPAVAMRRAPAVSAAINGPGPSRANPATGTLPRVTNTTPHALGRGSTLANAPSAHISRVIRVTPTTTALWVLAVALKRARRLPAAGGEVARTLTARRGPARLPFPVATDALPGAGETFVGPGQALAGTPEALAGAGEALPGVLEGSPALALPLSVFPGLPVSPFPVPVPGQLPGIALGAVPAQGPPGALAAHPPLPAPVGSSAGGSLAGGFEAGLPSPSAQAWASPAPQMAIGSAQGGGALGCVAARTEELLMEPCGAARARLPGHGGSFLVGAAPLRLPSRDPPLGSGASGVRSSYVPASVLAGSGGGGISGGSSSSAAGAPGFALTTLLTLAALLLLACPRVMRRLSLACEQWLATAFALIPERPG